MHWPIAFQPGDVKMPKNPDGTMNYGDTPFIDTWAAMEKLVDEGLVKHIGLSNFNSKQIDEVSKIQYSISLQFFLILVIIMRIGKGYGFPYAVPRLP
jgi:diketogulonate reductase-like aldo/keto reductase